MVIYVIQLTILMLVAFFLYKIKFFSKKTKDNIMCIVSFFVLTLPIIFRSKYIGADLPMYYDAFEKIGKSSWDFSDFRYEKGYCAFVKILYILFNNPQSLIIATSIIVNLSFIIFIKNKSKNVSLAIILYMTCNIFFFYMSALRQGLSLAIVLLALCLLNKDKKRTFIYYYLLSLLSITFHTVGVVSLFFPIFLYLKPTKKTCIMFGVIGVVCVIFYQELFNLFTSIVGDYKGYKQGEFSRQNYFGALLMFLEMLFIFLIITIKCKKRENYYSQWLNFSVIYLIALALVMRMNIFNRISTMFSIFFVVWVTTTLPDCKNKKLLTTGIVTMLTISMTVILVLRPEWHGVSPFEFCWQN